MLASPVPPPPAKPLFRVAFAGAPVPDGPIALSIRTPWLAGTPDESLFPEARPLPVEHGVSLYRAGDLWVGHVQESFPVGGLAEAAESLYRRILAATEGRHLFRVWNYVPQINALSGGVENYRAFCLGRARAFEAVLGSGFESRLPAASAVGCEGSHLTIVFAAGPARPRHVENPEQIPAYRYPIEHGPRSPSFARATVAPAGPGSIVFVSGTAAIKGHQTIAPGRIDGQLDCTLDNLRLISRAVGLGDRFLTGPGARRQFKVYLRHPEDLQATRTRLEQTILQPGDAVTYLHAEICRVALDVEIEATFVLPSRAL